MSTIGDVAREAGVSRSTVSSVLTGRKAVSPDTRARIEAAIARLEFSVNSGARALATRRTMTLGLVVRFHEAEFGPALSTYVVAISDEARAHGYSVVLLTDPDGVDAVRRTIAERQVDGLVLMNLVDDDPRLEPIAATGFPAVLVGMPEKRCGLDAADLDFEAGARLLVDRLADAGHRTATMAAFPDELLASGANYVRRFRSAASVRAAERGLRLDHLAVPIDPAEARAVLHSALGPSGERPRALLVHNDAAVAMLPTVLQDLRLSVPADLSVVSLHSAELEQLFVLHFTSVESQPERVVHEAIELLVRRIDHPGEPAVARLVAPLLTERGSVSAPARR
jgi:DNA-binding LacI/PurR family transcriptional regulator